MTAESTGTRPGSGSPHSDVYALAPIGYTLLLGASCRREEEREVECIMPLRVQAPTAEPTATPWSPPVLDR